MSAQAPPDGDRSRGPQLLAIFWVEVGIASIVVALRMYVKRVMRSTSIDDWLMLAAMIISVSLGTLLVHYGLGRHMYYIPPEQILKVVKLNWIVQPFGIVALIPGKLSVAFFLLRLMGPNTLWRKWILYVNMVFITLLLSISTIINFVQCNPPRALWETVRGAKCWDPIIQANWIVGVSAYNSFCDLGLAILPITIVWNLKMNVKQKIGLCLLLGAGALSAVCAGIKAAQGREISSRSDLTWDTFGLYAWSASELFLNTICGSVPTLKPLYDRIAKGRPISTRNGYYQNSNTFRTKDKIQYSNGSMELPSSGGQSFGHASYNAAERNTINVDHSFDVESVSRKDSDTFLRPHAF